MYEMPDTLTVVALHVIFVARSCLHSDATACHRLVIERTREVVNVHGVYHVSDVFQSKVPLLVAGVSHSLVFDRKSLEDDVFVTLAVRPFWLRKIPSRDWGFETVSLGL